MRTWSRATGDTWCGYCSAIIPKGDAVLLVQIPGVPTPRRRCAACAGPPPPDLPDPVAPPAVFRAPPLLRVEPPSERLPFKDE